MWRDKRNDKNEKTMTTNPSKGTDMTQVDECRAAFERNTGLEWNQEGAEYAQDHFVGGWKAALNTRAPQTSGILQRKPKITKDMIYAAQKAELKHYNPKGWPVDIPWPETRTMAMKAILEAGLAAQTSGISEADREKCVEVMARAIAPTRKRFYTGTKHEPNYADQEMANSAFDALVGYLEMRDGELTTRESMEKENG